MKRRRRRPREHVRVLQDGKVVSVNKGVVYDSPVALRGFGRGKGIQTLAGIRPDFEQETFSALNAFRGSRPGPESRVETRKVKGDSSPSGSWKVTASFDSDGSAVVSKVPGGILGPFLGRKKEVVLEPGAVIPFQPFMRNFSYRGVDLTDATFPLTYEIQNTSFEGAILRNVGFCFLDDPTVEMPGAKGLGPLFRVAGVATASIRGSSFDRADLSNSVFDSVTFNNTSMRGADLTGATFKDCRFWETETSPGYSLDVRGSNFHPSMLGVSEDVLTDRRSRCTLWSIKYDPYSARQAMDVMGVDEETFSVMVWAGDVEVRDNKTLELVVGTFDAKKHHVPQWYLNDYLDGLSSEDSKDSKGSGNSKGGDL